MSINEAVELLAACKPLANNLTQWGADYQLNDDELAKLEGYCRVYKSDFYDDATILRKAGLSPQDDMLLNVLMWRNHDSMVSSVTEAIMTLTASKSIVSRHSKDQEPIITEAEITVLNRVNQLRTVGMINNEQILQASGLNPEDLVGLGELMARMNKAA
jgi:hypothetical protein